MSFEREDPLARPAYGAGNEAVGAPNLAHIVASLNYRVQQMERRVSLTDRSGSPEIETARWGTEEPSVATSPPHRVVIGGWLYEFSIDLRVAGTGDTTVDLYYAPAAGVGSNLGTATITSGNRQSNPVTIAGILAAPGDQLWVDATALGTGVLGLAAYARMA